VVAVVISASSSLVTGPRCAVLARTAEHMLM
jgi:hypothetical protein